MKIIKIKDCRECPYGGIDKIDLEAKCKINNENILAGQSTPVNTCPLKDINMVKKDIADRIEDLIVCGGDWEETVENIIKDLENEKEM